MFRGILRRPPTLHALILAALIVLAAALRFYGLTRESLWNDELSTMWRVLPDVWEGQFWELIRKDVHPPGYLFLMNLWTRLVGNGEWALRFPSALAGTSLVALGYFFNRRALSRNAGLAGACLLAISPLLIEYSQEARACVSVTFASLASALALLHLLQAEPLVRKADESFVKHLIRESTARWRVIFATGVSFALSAYLHYSGFLVALSLGAFAWIYVVAFRRTSWRLVAGASLLATLLYVPWVPGLLLHLERGGLSFLGPPTLDQLKDVLEIALPSFGLGLCLLFAGLSKTFKEERVEGAKKTERTKPSWLGAALLLWWVLTITFGFYFKSVYGESIYNARNLLVIVPPTLLLAGLALATPAKRVLPLVVFLVVLTGLVLGDWIFEQEFYSTLRKEDFRGAAQSGLEAAERYKAKEILCYSWRSKYFEYYSDNSKVRFRCVWSEKELRKKLTRALKSGKPVVVVYAHMLVNARWFRGSEILERKGLIKAGMYVVQAKAKEAQ